MASVRKNSFQSHLFYSAPAVFKPASTAQRAVGSSPPPPAADCNSLCSCTSRRRRRTANDCPPPVRAITYCIPIHERAREGGGSTAQAPPKSVQENIASRFRRRLEGQSAEGRDSRHFPTTTRAIVYCISIREGRRGKGSGKKRDAACGGTQ